MKFKNKNKIKKNNRRLVCIFFVISIILAFYSINEAFSLIKGPKTEKMVYIPEKSSMDRISKILKENKIISNTFLFKVFAKFQDYKNLKSGKFKLTTNMNYKKIIDTLHDQSQVIYDEKVAINEGMNFFTLKEKFNNKLSIKVEDLIDEINNEENFSEFSTLNKIGKENLNKTYFLMEGFILPYTFPIHEGYTAKSIAKDILKKSEEKILSLKKDLENSKLSLSEIFTLASIIQAETSDENEMRKVSGVFHNRLKIKKILESDVTLLYAEKIKNDMKNKGLNVDLEKIKKYNTYKVSGLPPGPICTPSIAAIKAAANPEKNDYYFFYADKEKGKIFYEKDFESHKKNYINKQNFKN